MLRIDHELFRSQFQRFKRVVAQHDSGRAFSTFHEGVVAVWEGYKPRLRDRARGILAPETWAESQIGSGGILKRVIEAIEVQDNALVNNLVFWQNRYGHANREHYLLLEAVSNADRGRQVEAELFGLYCREADEGGTFDRLSHLTGAKYPLLAYLHFLKDMERFAPIQPTTFDRAFRELGINLVTVRNCSWENYEEFNAALGEVREALARIIREPIKQKP